MGFSRSTPVGRLAAAQNYAINRTISFKSLYHGDELRSLHDLETFFACSWSVASASRGELQSVAAAAAAHPGPAAVVSSCQRIEAYHLAQCQCGAPLRLSGFAAISHLAEVAAGLHSVVLGESEILGQVRKAVASSAPSISRHASIAIASARDLRAETAFQAHTGHLLDRALRLTGTPPTGRILVLGAGVTARAVAVRATQLGFESVVMVSRTRPEGAWFDAVRYGFHPLAELKGARASDVLVACLGSGAPELDIETGLPPVRTLMIDLGTPRNLGGKPAVRVIDIAEMERNETPASHSHARRTELRARLQTILQRRLVLAHEDSSSTVGTFRRSVEEVRQAEVARARRLHPEVPAEFIDSLTNALVNQLFHLPTQRLRESADARLTDHFVALFRPTKSAEEVAR